MRKRRCIYVIGGMLLGFIGATIFPFDSIGKGILSILTLLIIFIVWTQIYFGFIEKEEK